MPFTFERQKIPEVILVIPRVFGDERGFFMETYKKSDFENLIPYDFHQDNHSKSDRGVLRGLHYQLNPFAQGKLVRVIQGSVYDIAVDIRKGSPTYGSYVGVTLTAEEKNMLWIPSGFAHGFLSLEDHTEFLYKTTSEYSPEHERGILYNDPVISIEWPIPASELILSDRDKKMPLMKEAENNFFYQ